MRNRLLRSLAGSIVFSALAFHAAAQTATVSDDLVKIGVLTDMSGIYSDLGGKGSVLAAQMAVEDFGGKILGKPIEVISGDHQNKADIGSTLVRSWYDTQKVDMITDVSNSGVALAAAAVTRDKNRVALITGPSTTRLTNEDCTPNTVHYAYDAYALAHGTGKTVVKQGGESWYFLTVDFAFGHGLERETTEVIKANGGKVLGSSRHPLGATDYSAFLLQAQASNAKIIGLANTGADAVNAIKAAKEFGLIESGKQNLAGLLLWINDVHALGLDNAKGMWLTTAFYWDRDDETRKFSKRYFEKTNLMPNMSQAGVYSATLHYLRAVEAAGTDDAKAVMAKMRETPINDMFVKNGKIREDGRMVREMYLVQVKNRSESKGPWDYYNIRATIPGDEAFQPLSQSRCPLIKK